MQLAVADLRALQRFEVDEIEIDARVYQPFTEREGVTLAFVHRRMVSGLHFRECDSACSGGQGHCGQDRFQRGDRIDHRHITNMFA